MLELSGRNRPAAILVQCSECQLDHFLIISIAHLLRHHVAELRKLYFPRTIRVILYLIDIRQ